MWGLILSQDPTVKAKLCVSKLQCLAQSQDFLNFRALDIREVDFHFCDEEVKKVPSQTW